MLQSLYQYAFKTLITNHNKYGVGDIKNKYISFSLGSLNTDCTKSDEDWMKYEGGRKKYALEKFKMVENLVMWKWSFVFIQRIHRKNMFFFYTSLFMSYWKKLENGV